MASIRKIAFTIATVATCLASPAFAQSYVPSWGTGNVLPFEYGPGGTRLGPEKLYAARHSGIYAYDAETPKPERSHRSIQKAVRPISPHS